ncbi:hypothetical protein UFOVP707_87 [uncultured Caudovirales phage]|uniref:Uncharacterized protein n=1 Tax=uncultured Caudovirales phage TaxID=2100421 RepID=A0A6J5NQE9_9CAUD|nr:hypothetical protein UFOVP707_87 [uncultured Caudovirales phage]
MYPIYLAGAQRIPPGYTRNMKKHTPITFRDWWLASTRPQREAVGLKVDRSYRYLQKLSGGFARPSYPLLQDLKRAIPGLDDAGFEKAAQEAGQRPGRGL